MQTKDDENDDVLIECITVNPDLANAPLWDADPNCQHEVICCPSGGIRCIKCRGWFCY